MKTSNSQLLGLKEQLPENLSSNQIAEILDDLLFKFMEKVIINTDYMEYVITELIIHVFTDARRKFSRADKKEFKETLFSLIVCNNKQMKIKLLRELRLERTIYFKILENFTKLANEYLEELPACLKAGKPSEKILTIERTAHSINSNFYSVCVGTLFWSVHIYNFRNMIVEKYIRFARVKASKAVNSTGLNVSVDDLHRELIIAIFKGINKYDQTTGTLTECIQWWFKDATTNQNSHEEGVAYTIPSQVRKKMLESGTINIYEPIGPNTMEITDEESISKTMEQEEEHVVISNLSCRVDSDKIFVLLNNLKYSPTDDDIRALQATM